ncbi:unknown [Gryllus bimaculatus nudivirus]|uniref:Uncharacterized protein n=1 Tax=Gryllus bimaculatus nudivirus TaxID=432587 RepID=A4L1Z9_9VIRU|nr:hypothetical protein GrBNV_gp36 [Gryllus bimaculatus nudivirus]ABO45369.1 unknown [Gryllus bimaculatus nudivirus]
METKMEIDEEKTTSLHDKVSEILKDCINKQYSLNDENFTSKLDDSPNLQIIDIENVPSDHVIIPIPEIFVNVVNQKKHHIKQNFVAIPFEVLKYHINLMLRIEESVNAADIFEINKDFTTKIINSKTFINNKNIKYIINFLDAFNEFQIRNTLSDLHVDVYTNGISVDVIRIYKNKGVNEFGMLESWDIGSVLGYSLFSQITDKEDLEKVLKITNTTDYNFMLFCLKMFEKTLLFDKLRYYDNILKFSTLCFFYLSLLSNSLVLKNYASTDVLFNILIYLLDCCIKTKTVHYWRLYNKEFLTDFQRNYNKNYILIKLCLLAESKDRFNTFIKIVSEKIDFLKSVTYEKYEKSIENSIIEIDNFGKFYHFNSKTLVSILSIFGEADFQKFIETAENIQHTWTTTQTMLSPT